MANKWHGVIGFIETKETAPGIWSPIETERKYYGDIIRNTNRWTASSDSTNDDFNINNQISVVADSFAYQNFNTMHYIEFMGTKWKISSIEVQYPRLILSIGGVYKSEQA